MTSWTRRAARRRWALLACGAALAAMPAQAQDRWQDRPPESSYGPPRPVPQQPRPPVDGGADLRRSLTEVGSNPGNVGALIQSGRAALDMGDAQAALTFFSRADELAPRDGRIRAGMAAAMTQLGQPRPALTLFSEAVSFGAPEAEIAADRGLAHDLLGDQRAAQRDYVGALRRREDPETRRRLALSLAISGHREAALRVIDEQIRRNDRAGWRVQAFVLALTGDADGAARVAAGTMPGAGQAMAPFLARLPSLSPAQRAMAVHLGVFPADGRPQYAATAEAGPDPAALAFAGVSTAPPPVRVAEAEAGVRRRAGAPGRSRREQTGLPALLAENRRPNAARRESAPLPPPARRRSTETLADRLARSAAEPARTQIRPRQDAPPSQPPPPAADTIVAATPPPASETIAPALPPAGNATAEVQVTNEATETAVPPVDSAVLQSVRPGDTIVGPGFSIAPTPAPPVTLAPAAPPPLSERRNSALGDIASLVNALPPDQAGTAMRQAVPPVSPPVERPAPPSPARHWVQIAGSIERRSMTGEFNRLRGRAPALLTGMQAWAAGSRLLVGPFGGARDAQAFVNQLRPRGIEALAWQSAAGQTVDRLTATAVPAARTARAAPERRTAAPRRESAESQRPATPSRTASGRNEGSRAAAGSRAARGRSEDTRTAGSRTAQPRNREETRSGPGARGTRDRAETARNRTDTRRNDRAAATGRSNRAGSTVERRANGNDARPSRSRSAAEQRPAARGRRAD